MLRFVHKRTPATVRLSFKDSGYSAAITIKDLQDFVNHAKELGADNHTIVNIINSSLSSMYVEIIEQ